MAHRTANYQTLDFICLQLVEERCVPETVRVLLLYHNIIRKRFNTVVNLNTGGIWCKTKRILLCGKMLDMKCWSSVDTEQPEQICSLLGGLSYPLQFQRAAWKIVVLNINEY